MQLIYSDIILNNATTSYIYGFYRNGFAFILVVGRKNPDSTEQVTKLSKLFQQLLFRQFT